MKVLFLTNIPSPYRVDFFNELGKLCDLTVLYELSNASDRDENWKSDKCKNFKEVFLKGKKIGADSALCMSVLKYLKDMKYDIIVVGGYSTPTGMLAIQFLKLINRPFILSCDGGMIKNDNFLKKIMKSYFIGSATYWLSTGENTTKYLLHYGASKDKVFVYPFTSIKECDIEKSLLSEKEKQNIRDELNIKEKKVIISVGQFIYRKGFDILIEAMAYLPSEYGAYIIGGKATQEYIDLKNKYKLDNVHFIDFKEKQDLKKYYMMADLFVFPTREDVWGLVINEAMAHGLPVITTDKCIAGLELVKDYENGFIVSVENSSNLRACIDEILNNDTLCAQLSKKSLKKIEKYTIENMAKKHIDLFYKCK